MERLGLSTLKLSGLASDPTHVEAQRQEVFKDRCRFIGASIWAARRVKKTITASPCAFPRHTSAKGTNVNSASADINKSLKLVVPEGSIIHRIRHSLRDGLRAAQCPAKIIDQIAGSATSGVGESFGERCGLASTFNAPCEISKAPN